MNVPSAPGGDAEPLSPATGAGEVQPAPVQAPSPQEGTLPETLDQSVPLSNSTGFSPDESPAPKEPEAPSQWDVFMQRLRLASLDSGLGIPGLDAGPVTRELQEGAIDIQHELTDGAAPSLFAQAKGAIDDEYNSTSQTKLTPEDANKQYPGLAKPFSEPVYPETAQLIAKTQQRRQELQAWIANAPALTKTFEAAVGGVAGAAAGIPGGPAGVILGGAGGAGFGLAFGPESVVAGAANPATWLLGGFAGAAGRALAPAEKIAAGGIAAVDGAVVRESPNLINRALQNLAVNVGTAAIDYPQLNQEQDVSLKDEAIGIIGGTLGGIAVHSLVEAGLLRALGQARKFTSSMDEPTKARNLRAAIAQHETGANVDMSPAVAEHDLRAAGAANPDTGDHPYEFSPVDHPADKTYYAAKAPQSDAPVPLEDFGSGLYASDNGMVANNLASSPESPFTGSVQEIHIPEDAKFLDIDEPLPKVLASQLPDEVLAVTDVSSTPAKEVLNLLQNMPTGPADDFRKQVEAQGYDGYQYTHDSGGTPSNGLVVFNPQKARLGEEFTANKEITPSMSEPEIQAASERAQESNNSRTYEPGIDARISELQRQTPPGSDPEADMKFVEEQTRNALADLKRRAAEDPTLLEDPEYKALVHDETQAKQEAQVMKDFADCIVGDST